MSNRSSTFQLSTQWSHPGDVLSVLLIIGGDVIQRALAQLSGGYLTPVTFSFGWVVYSFNFMFAVGDKKLMPEPDCRAIVVNAKNGYIRTNRSWILGRILRDFEYWKPAAVSKEIERIIDSRRTADWERERKRTGKKKPPMPPKCERAGLCISIFHTSQKSRAGTPTKDLVFYSGILTAVLQLSIAAIPFVLHDQWSNLMITAYGTVLAFASGALSQWRKEKWQCRRGAKTIILTRGNGAQHAIVIIGDEDALNLEDLADADGVERTCSLRIGAALLAVLWLVLLITVSGLKQDTWFVLAVGGIGMIHNVYVAGAARKPEAFGLHLEYRDVEVIAHHKVMKALMILEDKHPDMGASLVPVFFPGKLNDEEEEYWSLRKAAKANEGNRAKSAKENKVANPAVVLPPLAKFTQRRATLGTAYSSESDLSRLSDYKPPGINRPAQVQDLPALVDVIAATTFKTQVDEAVVSHAPGAPTADDAAKAGVYNTVHPALAVAPAWFQPAMNEMLAPFRILLAQTRNRQLYDGNFTPFVIVPFNDGSMPTQAPHNLPPLTSVATIGALTDDQTTAYAAGYGIGNVGPAPERRAAIGRAVGCTTSIYSAHTNNQQVVQ